MQTNKIDSWYGSVVSTAVDDLIAESGAIMPPLTHMVAVASAAVATAGLEVPADELVRAVRILRRRRVQSMCAWCSDRYYNSPHSWLYARGRRLPRSKRARQA